MLLTALAALTFACSPSPTAPEPPDVAPLFNVVLPGGDTLRLTLTYMCGNRWRVRNPHAQALDVTWDVFRTTARGALTLPARPDGAAFSESFFETPVAGTTRVFFQTRLVQTKAHGNRACQGSGSVLTMQPPDTAPSREWVRDSLGFLSEDPQLEVGKGLFVIEFHDSVAVQNRQRLVDSLRGRLLGGEDSGYVIAIPDNGTWDAMRLTVERLRGHPHVREANLVWYGKVRVRGLWRRPNGTAAWRVMRPIGNDAGDQYRAHEAIRAPLAWGCSTGDTSIGIGVLDTRFDGYGVSGQLSPDAVIDDVSPNSAIEELGHGTLVAHVLGANGDDSLHLSGLLWRSSLNLQSVSGSRPGERVQSARRSLRQSMLQLGRHGLVINISIGADDPRSADLAADEASTALRQLTREGRRPLVVVVAGNEGGTGRTTRDNGFPRLGRTFPAQVLVVGGTISSPDPAGAYAMWQQSTPPAEGDRVDVFAPADQVYTTDRLGQDVPAEGTSFAAPLVSGTAGLILSFDSRLQQQPASAAQIVRDLLLRGAAPNSGVPMLDAYGALKAAARRPGAPLCGNRVWADSATVKTRRESSDEVLFVAPGTVTGLFTHHGGKRVDVSYLGGDPFEPSTERATYRWTEGTWTRDASGPAESFGPFTPGLEPSGASRSPLGISHDFSELVGAGTTPDPAGVVVTAFRSAVDGSRSDSLPAITLALPVAPDSVCVFSFLDLATNLRRCGRYEYGGSFALAYGTAFSPLETESFAAIGGSATTVVPASNWTREGCFSSLLAFPECRTATTSTRSFGWLIRWRFDGSAPTILPASGTEAPVFVAANEAGDELVVLREGLSGNTTTCAVEWLDAQHGTVRDRRSLTSTATCRNRGAPFTHAALRAIAARP